MLRSEAWDLLTEWTLGEPLRKHALSVEAAMRAYARRFNQDEELWGLTGLLHDFDYERHPTAELHPAAGAPVLRERGVAEDVIYAIQSHADYLGLDRAGLMDKALFAVDELCGFAIAVALVRPSRSIHDVDVGAVRRKMKDKAFARAVRREDIVEGAALLGVEVDEHIATVLGALRPIADQLGVGS
ncbi:MAG: HDIG domain-containing protein [Chloroflexota bacterium]|nr:MAG: HDIG domain-containing protein [Chloroflexota bacterium]